MSRKPKANGTLHAGGLGCRDSNPNYLLQRQASYH